MAGAVAGIVVTGKAGVAGSWASEAGSGLAIAADELAASSGVGACAVCSDPAATGTRAVKNSGFVDGVVKLDAPAGSCAAGCVSDALADVFGLAAGC